jgi:hypothetical protein
VHLAPRPPGSSARSGAPIALAGLRIWLDDITGGDCGDPWWHLEQIFDTEPLLAGRDEGV